MSHFFLLFCWLSILMNYFFLFCYFATVFKISLKMSRQMMPEIVSVKNRLIIRMDKLTVAGTLCECASCAEPHSYDSCVTGVNEQTYVLPFHLVEANSAVFYDMQRQPPCLYYNRLTLQCQQM